MAIRYDIQHTTIYRYNQPVTFGLHRVMFRPRDSHDLRVLATDLQVSPASSVRLIQDPHSNSVALVQPLGEATELKVVCSFTIEHVPPSTDLLSELDPAAEFLPFAYSIEDRLDLEHYLRPHHPDPDGVLIRWAHQFLYTDAPNGTREVLARMNAHIGKTLSYMARDEEGTQTPLETLKLGSGSCRDFAVHERDTLHFLELPSKTRSLAARGVWRSRARRSANELARCLLHRSGRRCPSEYC